MPWALRGALRIPAMSVTPFIPLTFKPGEAYQSDWSHEDVEIAGKPPRVKVARLLHCASRAPARLRRDDPSLRDRRDRQCQLGLRAQREGACPINLASS